MQNVPAINVNLKQCDCASRGEPSYTRPHDRQCAAMPILVPCPIPRSVTFTVRLGECFCTTGDLRYMPQDSGGDLHICPARPIRVSCSISGKTWEESEVVLASVEPSNPHADRVKCMAACRERWALVKALILGKRPLLCLTDRDPAYVLANQRDAVYYALADKARVEQADDATTRALIKALPSLTARDVDAATASAYLSVRALAHYVEHLVEQIGVLP